MARALNQILTTETFLCPASYTLAAKAVFSNDEKNEIYDLYASFNEIPEIGINKSIIAL